MKNENIYKKILSNASEIAYFMNIFNELEEVVFAYDKRHKKHVMSGFNIEDGSFFAITIPVKVAKFLIKGRDLRSGLATPMARHYAYKALERK